MRIKFQRATLLLVSVASLLLTANVGWAQDDTTLKKRLRIPSIVRGSIGGESHDSYVIRARKGRIITVEISWTRDGDNRAEFTISESPDFFSASQVNFGRSYRGGKSWTGKLPRTGDYYIYVVGHPTADYKLRVRIK
jgi:hypothetical protein